jgi:formylglycine-generating enzyme required for sulfatase activity
MTQDDQAAEHEITNEARRTFEPEMVLIPSGPSVMGSDPLAVPAFDEEEAEAAYAGGWETPQTRIVLPDFHLARTPVTHAQYGAFLEQTDHPLPKRWRSRKVPRGKDDLPIVYVSWHDATTYCRWLATVTSKPYRLPSEAEWEKGARGPDGWLYPWGDRWAAGRCNTAEAEGSGITPVDAYPEGSSLYGLLDMAGNVWEWTQSLWGPAWYRPDFTYPYDPEDGREDAEASDDVCRVLRGGSYAYGQAFARCAYRYKNFPQNVSDGTGFRVALGLPSGSPQRGEG